MNKDLKEFIESHIEEIAEKYDIPMVAKLPIDPSIAASCDKGQIEDINAEWLTELCAHIEKSV